MQSLESGIVAKLIYILLSRTMQKYIVGESVEIKSKDSKLDFRIRA